MRISDWSSDVCSSDLLRLHHDLRADALPAQVLDFLIEGGVNSLLHGLALRRCDEGIGELRLAAAPAQDDGRQQEGEGELALQLGPGAAVADRPQHIAPGPKGAEPDIFSAVTRPTPHDPPGVPARVSQE